MYPFLRDIFPTDLIPVVFTQTYIYIYIQVHTNDSAHKVSSWEAVCGSCGRSGRSPPGAQRAAPPPASPALPASPRPLAGVSRARPGAARIPLPRRTRVRPLQQTARRLRSRRTGKRQTPPFRPHSPPSLHQRCSQRRSGQVLPTFPLRFPEVGPEAGARPVCVQAAKFGATQPRPLK